MKINMIDFVFLEMKVNKLIFHTNNIDKNILKNKNKKNVKSELYFW